MIGIFDSGVGGLSVLREIVKVLPHQDFIYFADNLHCPYGEKSREYITDRARKITEFLIGHKADIIVIACNTATSAAISTLRKEYSDKTDPLVREKVLRISEGRRDHIMFIGMEPAVKPAAEATKSGTIGVLATAGTLKGEKYIGTRDSFTAGIKVIEHVGQGFVELVESGETDGERARETIARSLRPLLDAGADTIVLGCTHYPFLKETMEEVASAICPQREVRIIDPAPAVAKHLLKVMEEDAVSYEQEDHDNNCTDSCGNSAPRGMAHRCGGKIELVASGDDSVLRETALRIFPPDSLNDSSNDSLNDSLE